jgi:MbtH protein
VTAPFDDERAAYVVLRSEAGDACLWPAWAAVPAGWAVAHGPGPRGACLGWIEALER